MTQQMPHIPPKTTAYPYLKKKLRALCALCGKSSALYLLLVPVLLSACAAEGAGGAISGTLVWQGEHVYEEGAVIQGQLVVLNGDVRVAEGARVDGSVYVAAGQVQIAGEVDGDVAIIGGDLLLEPAALIEGDLSLGGGDAQVSPQATVRGEVLGGADVAVSLDTLFPQPDARDRLLRLLPQALLTAALAYLVARFLGRPLDNARRAAVQHPIVSGALGLLVAIVGPSLLVLMAFTVILIPVTFLAVLLTGAVVLYAWIALGAALGHWLRRRFDRQWSTPVATAIGAFVFMAVTDLLVFIPFVGGWIGILATVVGVGAIFLTRLGLRPFEPSYDFAPPRAPEG